MSMTDYIFIISLNRLKNGKDQWFPVVSCSSINEATEIFEKKYGKSKLKKLDMVIFSDEKNSYWSIYPVKGSQYGLITKIPFESGEKK